MKNEAQTSNRGVSRRGFLQGVGSAGTFLGVAGVAGHAAAAEAPKDADGKVIPGFEKTQTDPNAAKGWQPFSDRKIRVGIAGYGLCQIRSAVRFPEPPECRGGRGHRSDPRALRRAGEGLPVREDLSVVRGDDQGRQDRGGVHRHRCAESRAAGRRGAGAREARRLRRAGGLRFARGCRPPVRGREEERPEVHDVRDVLFPRGSVCVPPAVPGRGLGKIIYSEGEYYHYFGKPLGGYNPKTSKVDTNGWRKGLPPQWYPTHSNAYYIGVTGGSFTEVSCMGMPSIVPHLQAANNDYKNPFGSEIALFRTSEGGMSRMAVCWDLPAARRRDRAGLRTEEQAGAMWRPTGRPCLPAWAPADTADRTATS